MSECRKKRAKVRLNEINARFLNCTHGDLIMGRIIQAVHIKIHDENRLIHYLTIVIREHKTTLICHRANEIVNRKKRIPKIR